MKQMSFPDSRASPRTSRLCCVSFSSVRCFLHILTLLTLSYRIIHMDNDFVSNAYALEQSWKNILLPKSLTLANETISLTNSEDGSYEALYTIPSVVSHIHEILDRYYTLPNNSVANLRISHSDSSSEGNYSQKSPQDYSSVVDGSFVWDESRNSSVPYPFLQVEHYKTWSKGKITSFVTFKNRSADSFPIGLKRNSTVDQSHEFFEKLSSLTMFFYVRTYLNNSGGDAVQWELRSKYDLSAQGQIVVRLESHRSTVSVAHIPFTTSKLQDVLLILLCATYSLLLFAEICCQQISCEKRGQENPHNTLVGSPSSHAATPLLPAEDKESKLEDNLKPSCGEESDRNDDTSHFIGRISNFRAHVISNGWNILLVGSNLGMLLCSLKTLFEVNLFVMYDSTYHMLYGSSCAGLCISLLSYVNRNDQSRIDPLTNALSNGFPRVVEFLIGVLPIYIGYVFFGSIMFGSQSDRFKTIGHTATTLFAVANGDEIRSTFQSLSFNPIISQIYLYSFIILFTYVVLMVCIGVIEEAFFLSSHTLKFPPKDSNELCCPETTSFVTKEISLSREELTSSENITWRNIENLVEEASMEIYDEYFDPSGGAGQEHTAMTPEKLVVFQRAMLERVKHMRVQRGLEENIDNE